MMRSEQEIKTKLNKLKRTILVDNITFERSVEEYCYYAGRKAALEWVLGQDGD